MLTSNPLGSWFYGLRADEILFVPKDTADEYCLLNCPQEYVGPFHTKQGAEAYKTSHPNASKEFNKMLKEMEEFYFAQ